MTLRAAALALLAAAAPAAPAAAQFVDHPAYLSWAAHPVGTRIAVREVDIRPDGVRTTTTTVSTLKKRTDELVEVELVVTRDVTGKVVTDPPAFYTTRRKFPLLPGVKKEDIGKPANPIDRGTETLRVGDREIRAEWFETKGRNESEETRNRTWISDEVPGRLVKGTIVGAKSKKVTEIDLVEFTTP